MKKEFKLITLLFAAILVLVGCSKGKSYYFFGGYNPEYSNKNEIIENGYTDYKEIIDKNGVGVFAKMNGEQFSICIYKNEKLECFENNNYKEESKHAEKVFSNCPTSNDEKVWCLDEDFSCSIESDGDVSCSDKENGGSCGMRGDGRVECYKPKN